MWHMRWDVARHSAAHGTRWDMARHGVAHGVVWHVACGMASHDTGCHRPTRAVLRCGTTPHGATRHTTLRDKRPGTATDTGQDITAAQPESHVPAAQPGPLLPLAPLSQNSQDPVTRRRGVTSSPPRASARWCPAAPPDSVAGSIAAGTAAAALAPAAVGGHLVWGRCCHEAARAGLWHRG